MAVEADKKTPRTEGLAPVSLSNGGPGVDFSICGAGGLPPFQKF